MSPLPLFVSAVSAFCLTAFACSPSISSDTYFCGPEGLCPSGQACNFGQADFAYNCRLPESTSSFSCPSSTDVEPDDTPGQAAFLGQLLCDTRIEVPDFGCITTKDDVDHFSFNKAMSCAGDDPNNEIRLQYPIGAAPLIVELLDPAMAIIATGEICSSEVDIGTGRESLCIAMPDLPTGDYTVRVAFDAQGNADCEGACEFNRYKIVLSARSR